MGRLKQKLVIKNTIQKKNIGKSFEKLFQTNELIDNTDSRVQCHFTNENWLENLRYFKNVSTHKSEELVSFNTST